MTMHILYLIISFVLFIANTFLAYSQKANSNSFEEKIMFYNCENLFDPFDDPKTGDNEFTPNSKRNWSQQKYHQKLQQISKVILSTGIETPSIIGFAEVENEFVLNQLINKTALQKFPFKIIHSNSPDPRGIDVAAIYRTDKFKLLSFIYIPVERFTDNILRTRDILYIKGYFIKTDTLHIFFNHWPSRRGDRTKTEQNRIAAAKVLRKSVDSLFQNNIHSKIIIMGDFNDEPDNKSIVYHLKAKKYSEKHEPEVLVNLSAEWMKNISFIGTYKYKQSWNILDQIIVSSSLIQVKQGYIAVQAKIHAPDFLLIKDEKYGGKMLFRTYYANKYMGGFSDHLPILLILKCKGLCN